MEYSLYAVLLIHELAVGGAKVEKDPCRLCASVLPWYDVGGACALACACQRLDRDTLLAVGGSERATCLPSTTHCVHHTTNATTKHAASD